MGILLLQGSHTNAEAQAHTQATNAEAQAHTQATNTEAKAADASTDAEAKANAAACDVLLQGDVQWLSMRRKLLWYLRRMQGYVPGLQFQLLSTGCVHARFHSRESALSSRTASESIRRR
jgi:hypothetical protein